MTSSDVREQILRVLSGDLDLEGLDDWLLDEAWDDNDVEQDAVLLVRDVQLLLSEFTGGAWTENDVRDHLEKLVWNVDMSWGVERASVRCSTGGTSQLVHGSFVGGPVITVGQSGMAGTRS